MTEQRFPKGEKLKSKREISLLFEKGKWQTCGNLRVISLDLETKPQENISISHQKFGVSVSKRNLKKAVDRNRIKRLLRECYRLQKPSFSEAFGTHSLTMMFWISKELPKNYREVENEFLRLCKSKK